MPSALLDFGNVFNVVDTVNGIKCFAANFVNVVAFNNDGVVPAKFADVFNVELLLCHIAILGWWFSLYAINITNYLAAVNRFC